MGVCARPVAGARGPCGRATPPVAAAGAGFHTWPSALYKRQTARDHGIQAGRQSSLAPHRTRHGRLPGTLPASQAANGAAAAGSTAIRSSSQSRSLAARISPSLIRQIGLCARLGLIRLDAPDRPDGRTDLLQVLCAVRALPQVCFEPGPLGAGQRPLIRHRGGAGTTVVTPAPVG